MARLRNILLITVLVMELVTAPKVWNAVLTK